VSWPLLLPLPNNSPSHVVIVFRQGDADALGRRSREKELFLFFLFGRSIRDFVRDLCAICWKDKNRLIEKEETD
jgi:hypothetical protein